MVSELISRDSTSSAEEMKKSRIYNYRTHLRTITKSLIEMAKASGRTEYTSNQLLRECYQQEGTEFHTLSEWNEMGAYVRKGEHAYLFWGAPVRHPKGYQYNPIEFLFSREQVQFREKYKKNLHI